MAIISGLWVPSASSSKRMKLDINISVPTPAVGATSIVVTGSVIVYAGYSFNDSSNTFQLSGTLGSSFSGAKSINVATNGSQTIHTFSQTVVLGNTTQSKSISASLTGIEYLGMSTKATVSGTVTIPARRFNVPNTPWSVVQTRQADNRRTLAWETSLPGDKPVDSFIIERSTLSTGRYVTVATVSGNARSWVDTTNLPNDQVNYRIRARNVAGDSATATSNSTRTTPAAPSGVTGVRKGATDVVLTWGNAARCANYIDIQAASSTDGKTWSSMANVSGHTGLSAATTTRTIAGLDTTKLWRFQVQAVAYINTSSSANGILAGTSSVSNVVQLLTKPGAPKLLAPSGTFNNELPLTFKLQKSHTDGSDITAAQMQWRAVDGAWSSNVAMTVAGTLTTSILVGKDPGDYEWRARTKGAHADWGDWSAASRFTLAARPTVTIIAPVDGQTLLANRAKIQISVYDAQGAAVTRWTRRLLDSSGQTIRENSGTGASLSYTFPDLLEDLTTYSVEAQVTTGTGLTSDWDRVTFTTDFLDPIAPTIDAIAWYVSEGLVRLSVDNPAGTPGVFADAVYNRIERSSDGWVTVDVVADELPLLVGVADWQAPTNRVVEYRAVAVSALGVEAVGPVVSVSTPSSFVYLGQAGSVTVLPYNLVLDGQHEPHVVLHNFLGRSKRLAVYNMTSEPSTSIGLGGITLDYSQEAAFVALLKSPVHYRDPAGRVFWAAISSTLSWAPKSPTGWAEVGLTIEEVGL